GKVFCSRRRCATGRSISSSRVVTSRLTSQTANSSLSKQRRWWPSSFDFIKIAPGVFHDQRIRIGGSVIEGAVIKVAKVHAFTGLLVETTRHRDSVTRHNVTVTIKSPRIGHMGQVVCYTKVFPKLR